MKVTSYKSQVTSHKTKQVFFSFALFFLFFFFTGDWKLMTGDLAFADQIKIRTIITPVGSQSEKWGAKGLMVCIGGEPINVGGCGTQDVNAFEVDGIAITTIEQADCDGTFPDDKDCGKMIFFLDGDDNHQFADDSLGNPLDTVYEARGGGGGRFVLVDTLRTGNDGTLDCQNAGYSGCVFRRSKWMATDLKWYDQDTHRFISDCSERSRQDGSGSRYTEYGHKTLCLE